MAPTAMPRLARPNRIAIGPNSTRRLAIRSQPQPVSAPEHGQDDLGTMGVAFDLAAQVLDVRVDGAFVAVELVPSDAVDQLGPGVHASWIARKRGDEPPLGGGECDGLALNRDLAALVVNDERPGSEAPLADG